MDGGFLIVIEFIVESGSRSLKIEQHHRFLGEFLIFFIIYQISF